MNFGNVLIFGDSYSTFADYIPEGYAAYYSPQHKEFEDVTSVTATWWHKLITETGSNLVLNNSWSGSTVCNTVRPGLPLSSSFVNRLDELVENGFFKTNQINTVFSFGGTNDAWVGSPINEVKFSDWQKEDLDAFAPSLCYILDTLKRVAPSALIICIANHNIGEKVPAETEKACKFYNVKFVKLENVDKKLGHPTAKGMSQIKDSILNAIFNIT